MAVSKADIQELKRISTNTYDADKAFINRIIKGIADLERENSKLKTEIELLRQQVAE